MPRPFPRIQSVSARPTFAYSPEVVGGANFWRIQVDVEFQFLLTQDQFLGSTNSRLWPILPNVVTLLVGAILDYYVWTNKNVRSKQIPFWQMFHVLTDISYRGLRLREQTDELASLAFSLFCPALYRNGEYIHGIDSLTCPFPLTALKRQMREFEQKLLKSEVKASPIHTKLDIHPRHAKSPRAHMRYRTNPPHVGN